MVRTAKETVSLRAANADDLTFIIPITVRIQVPHIGPMMRGDHVKSIEVLRDTVHNACARKTDAIGNTINQPH